MYSLEGDVEDVSRQHIANRASLLVHPAPWYIGLRRPSYFLQQKQGLKTEIVAVAPDGKVVPGVTVTVTLTQIQWNSVRRAEGNGFYTWDTERKEVPAGILDGHDRRRARAARPRRCPTAATSSSKRRRATRTSDTR